MNKVVLIGRLTKDPELKLAPGSGTAVTTFTLAVDRRFTKEGQQKETDFIPIVIWGKQAESTANYVTKGKLLGVSGRIQTRSYDAKDDTKRYITEVIAEEVQFLEWGNRAENTNNFGFNTPSGFGGNSFDMDMTPIDDGNDIPFS
jgi:single-strand DNA-binding protein